MLRHLSLPLIQTTCFFCQSHINPPPRDPNNFRCPHCQCSNRYDPSGEIISDEPAMHEQAFNTKSFAKRGNSLISNPLRPKPTTGFAALPRKDRFLPTYRNTVFCHTCQTNQVRSMSNFYYYPYQPTNQVLLTNLLANYLPSPEVRSHPPPPLIPIS